MELEAELSTERLRAQRRGAELAQWRKVNAEQREVIARLEQRVVDLEMRVRRDSTTTSAPPSTDKPWDTVGASQGAALQDAAAPQPMKEWASALEFFKARPLHPV